MNCILVALLKLYLHSLLNLVGQHTCHNSTVLPLAQLMTQHPLLGHDISFEVWIWMCEIS